MFDVFCGSPQQEVVGGCRWWCLTEGDVRLPILSHREVQHHLGQGRPVSRPQVWILEHFQDRNQVLNVEQPQFIIFLVLFQFEFDFESDISLQICSIETSQIRLKSTSPILASFRAVPKSSKNSPIRIPKEQQLCSNSRFPTGFTTFTTHQQPPTATHPAPSPAAQALSSQLLGHGVRPGQILLGLGGPGGQRRDFCRHFHQVHTQEVLGARCDELHIYIYMCVYVYIYIL